MDLLSNSQLLIAANFLMDHLSATATFISVFWWLTSQQQPPLNNSQFSTSHQQPSQYNQFSNGSPLNNSSLQITASFGDGSQQQRPPYNNQFSDGSPLSNSHIYISQFIWWLTYQQQPSLYNSQFSPLNNSHLHVTASFLIPQSVILLLMNFTTAPSL